MARVSSSPPPLCSIEAIIRGSATIGASVAVGSTDGFSAGGVACCLFVDVRNDPSICCVGWWLEEGSAGLNNYYHLTHS